MRQLKLTELGRVDPTEIETVQRLPFVCILDNVRSGLNTGAIFRSADAFLVGEVALCGYTAAPPHKEIMKTALGATETVPWQVFEDTNTAIKHYKALGYQILAIELTDTSLALNNWQPTADQKYALVVGNEVFGVSEEALALCDQAIEIPQSGAKHSLNVSICASIVMWHCYQALQLK
jgi:23S rRNA (guanosine2251-2'-O)-methyltransferase